ncbi:MAG TPA: FHA domain-containing protein [Candidatus Polarisedimenticolia bacterium]|nr:FHA domain-containing protein [Candidatus Polarisedimenticolia bacterium]
MEIFCPTCRSRMEAATDPLGGGRAHYICPQCEGEYRLPARPGTANTQAAPPRPVESPSIGDITVPGKPLAALTGDWQIPEELRFSLKVLEGAETGLTFEVTRSRTTVGREEGEIQLVDPLVSRKHAAFEIYGPQHIVVKDLASTNGTYLNGRLIAYSKLNHGDKIRIGSTLLEAVITVTV